MSRRREAQISSKLVQEIMQDELFQRLRACIQCGECTAGCPSGIYTTLRVRKVMRKVLTGIENVLEEPDIWQCATCYSCLEHCTRHIPVTEVIYKLRNMAVRESHIPEPFRFVIANLIETGHAVPIGGTKTKWTQLRKLHGFQENPNEKAISEKLINEIAYLLELISFYQRVPFRKK
jgi:heterodisulfide reductase subunit C